MPKGIRRDDEVRAIVDDMVREMVSSAALVARVAPLRSGKWRMASAVDVNSRSTFRRDGTQLGRENGCVETYMAAVGRGLHGMKTFLRGVELCQ